MTQSQSIFSKWHLHTNLKQDMFIH